MSQDSHALPSVGAPAVAALVELSSSAAWEGKQGPPAVALPLLPSARGDASSAGAADRLARTRRGKGRVVGGSAPTTHKGAERKTNARKPHEPPVSMNGVMFEDAEILHAMRRKAERHAAMNVRPWREVSAVPALPPLALPRNSNVVEKLDTARQRERERAWHGAHKTKEEVGVHSTVWCARVSVRALTEEERVMLRRRKEERIKREAKRAALAEAVESERMEQYERERAHMADASSQMRDALRKARKEEARLKARKPVPPHGDRPAVAPRRKTTKRVFPVVSAPSKPPKPRKPRARKLRVDTALPEPIEVRVDQACSPIPEVEPATEGPEEAAESPPSTLPPPPKLLAEAAAESAARIRYVQEQLAVQAAETAVRLGAFEEAAEARITALEALEIDNVLETCVRLCELDDALEAAAAAAAARDAEVEALMQIEEEQMRVSAVLADVAKPAEEGWHTVPGAPPVDPPPPMRKRRSATSVNTSVAPSPSQESMPEMYSDEFDDDFED